MIQTRSVRHVKHSPAMKVCAKPCYIYGLEGCLSRVETDEMRTAADLVSKGVGELCLSAPMTDGAL